MIKVVVLSLLLVGCSMTPEQQRQFQIGMRSFSQQVQRNVDQSKMQCMGMATRAGLNVYEAKLMCGVN